MATDYIRREAILANLDKKFCAYCPLPDCDTNCKLHYLLDTIKAEPAADVRPAVMGTWEIADSYAGPGFINLRCSVCGAFGGTWKDNTFRSMLPKFCNNCGADMRIAFKPGSNEAWQSLEKAQEDFRKAAQVMADMTEVKSDD